MYCSQCGTQVPDDSAFCHNCGVAIKPAGPVFGTSEAKATVTRRPLTTVVVLSVTAAALTVAAVLVAVFVFQPFEDGGSDDTARPISNEELTLMVLSQDEFGSSYSGLEVDSDESGPQSRDDSIADACDPDDEARDLDRTGWLTGHAQWYSRAPYGLFERPVDRETITVGSTVDLFESVDGAIDRFQDDVRETREESTGVCQNITFTGIAEFGVPRIADESWGAVIEGIVSDYDISMTGVAFRRGRIVASVAVAHVGYVDASDEAIRLAKVLDERITAMLSDEGLR